ncbi:MAG: phosphatase PAP2 family protein, partial [Oxalobacter sp.]|nr:phosphatase PAP2 family protein [Oxalobacter sp.]
MLLPLALLMLAVGFYSGFWGENIRLWHQEMRQLHPLLTRLMLVTSWGSAWMLYAAYAVILAHALRTNNRQEIAFIARFVFSLVCVLLIAAAMKVAFGMPRPGINLPSAPFSFVDDFVSFPSGHTVQIVTAALPLAFYFSKRWLFIAMSLLITLVGYSRLWLGQHHPIDVLGGIVVGSLIVVMVFRRTGSRQIC